METTTPHITRYIIQQDDGSERGLTFKVAAKSEEQAWARFSSVRTGCKIVGTEIQQYTHTIGMQAIASFMSKGDQKWEAVPLSDEYPDCDWYLHRCDGLDLWISAPGKYSHKTSWKVSYRVPMHNGNSAVNEQERPGSINIGSGKDPATIANDIKRRLLPAAEEAHLVAVQRIALWKTQENQRLEAWVRIRKAAGLDYVNMPKTSAGRGFQFSAGNVDFEIDYRGEVRVSFRSSVNSAEQIIKTILSHSK